MKSSYKIAILVAVAIFGFVIFHYATQESTPTNPDETLAGVNVDTLTTSRDAAASPTPSPTRPSASNPAPPANTANHTPPPPTGGSSLMDMINRRMTAEQADTRTPDASLGNTPAPSPGPSPSPGLRSDSTSASPSTTGSTSTLTPGSSPRTTSTSPSGRTGDGPSSLADGLPTPGVSGRSNGLGVTSSVSSVATDQSSGGTAAVGSETGEDVAAGNASTGPQTTVAGPSVVTLDGRPIDEQQLNRAPERSILSDWSTPSQANGSRDTLSDIDRRVTGGLTQTGREDAGARRDTPGIGDAPRTVAEQTYEVKSGDTLSGIAQTVYGRSNLWDKIAAANPEVDPNRLKLGEQLKIPQLTVSPDRQIHATDEAGPAQAGNEPGRYRIESGDTFSTIAAALYGTENKWIDIAQANPLVDPTKLKVGQVIRLPDAADVAATVRNEPDDEQPDPPGPTRSYTVRDTDTLSSIAQQFYGDSMKWRLIYNANRQELGPNPDRIPSDVTITLPPDPGP